ncbi:MAG: hypothetical protein QGI45_00710 [Myxococcota bacterium]|jgi:hypothetical protein|nr:hypothetical protein [Myxococcota bacterium]
MQFSQTTIYRKTMDLIDLSQAILIKKEMISSPPPIRFEPSKSLDSKAQTQ